MSCLGKHDRPRARLQRAELSAAERRARNLELGLAAAGGLLLVVALVLLLAWAAEA